MVDFMLIRNGPQSRLFLQSFELGHPHPFPFGSGGGTYSLAGEGVGGPNSDEGQTLWYSRYILGAFVAVIFFHIRIIFLIPESQ
jgi:hypothetical protein